MLSLKIDDMYLEAMYTPYIKYDKKDFNTELPNIVETVPRMTV